MIACGSKATPANEQRGLIQPGSASSLFYVLEITDRHIPYWTWFEWSGHPLTHPPEHRHFLWCCIPAWPVSPFSVANPDPVALANRPLLFYVADRKSSCSLRTPSNLGHNHNQNRSDGLRRLVVRHSCSRLMRQCRASERGGEWRALRTYKAHSYRFTQQVNGKTLRGCTSWFRWPDACLSERRCALAR